MAKKRHYYLCNVNRKTKHCKEKCFCGVPHFPEGKRDEKCTKVEFCKITGKFVKCEKITPKELKVWEKKGFFK